MNRLLLAHTTLGEAWRAFRLQGSEELSGLYEFRLELKSDDPGIDIQSRIGEVCAVECKADSSLTRYFSGHVIGAAARGESSGHWLYELRIAPKLWFASRRADFRIFQDQTVQAIADQILQQNAISYKWCLQNSYKTWEYVVQYGETDLAFLLRLFGHEGIYFWFEHGKDGETLILGDHFSAHEPFAGYETLPYYPPSVSHLDEDHFNAWHASRTAEPGIFTHTNYDFMSPSMDLTTASADSRGCLKNHEIFAYPGTYTRLEPEHGQKYAMARLQGLQTGQNVIVLEGPVRGAVPGCCFSLEKHPVQSLNRKFLITQAEYRVQSNDEKGATFYAKVSAMPDDQQYRASRESFEMPRAHGPDTAVVVGPKGDEIHTDKHGRVKVHFHWDRYGERDGNDSCWIRVAHQWAGKNFGSIHIPRIGQEVIVDYEHGNPERPIITGRVYNAEQMPPWDLPANKTQSGILTRTSPEGTPSNFNELRFEDAKGKENVWLHAERNQDIKVKVDETHWVGNSRKKIIGESMKEGDKNAGNEETTIFGSRIETVHKDETITVIENRTETVHKDETITVIGNRSETVDKDETITVIGNRTETVKGSESTTIHGHGRYQHVKCIEVNTTGGCKIDFVGGVNLDNVGGARLSGIGGAWVNGIGGYYILYVGMGMTTVVAKNQTTEVKGDRTIGVDKNQTTTVKEKTTLNTKDYIVFADGGVELFGKKTIKLRALDKLEISCGDSSIVMTSSGIALKSNKINLCGGTGGVNLDGGPLVRLNTGDAKPIKGVSPLNKPKPPKSSPPKKDKDPPNLKGPLGKAMGIAGAAMGAAGMAMGFLNKATEVVNTVTAVTEAIKGGPAGGLSSASDSSSGSPATAGSASPLNNPAVQAIASLAPTLAGVFA
ncbi:MAG: type VI secretion system tip protein VgrG [Betaproteobacteria bacterium]|nr:type VI secretion system tip protein VgrG [Betaproteobacteria bacterium]